MPRCTLRPGKPKNVMPRCTLIHIVASFLCLEAIQELYVMACFKSCCKLDPLSWINIRISWLGSWHELSSFCGTFWPWINCWIDQFSASLSSLVLEFVVSLLECCNHPWFVSSPFTWVIILLLFKHWDAI